MPGEKLDGIVVRMRPAGVIAGKVEFGDGLPGIGVDVRFFREYFYRGRHGFGPAGVNEHRRPRTVSALRAPPRGATTSPLPTLRRHLRRKRPRRCSKPSNDGPGTPKTTSSSLTIPRPPA